MKKCISEKNAYKNKRMLLSLLFTAFIFIPQNTPTYAANEPQAFVTCSKAQEELRAAMRKLWEEHITYTRNYIISALANGEDTVAVSERLLKNQDDIGKAIMPYYGAEAGKKLTDLLRDHILIATEVVKAAKENNKEAVNEAQKKWGSNGEEIAVFLANANPNWDKKALSEALQKHLDLTTGEVTSRLKKDWKGDIESYDKGHEHILILSDTLTNGIEKQFPDKFK